MYVECGKQDFKKYSQMWKSAICSNVDGEEGALVGCSLWGHTESDMTEAT